jgi:hypothetical protein
MTWKSQRRQRHAIDGAFDLEQFVDAAHCLNGDGRFGLLCQFEEVLRPWLQAASMIGAGLCLES